MTETKWPSKLKIFTIWPFTKCANAVVLIMGTGSLFLSLAESSKTRTAKLPAVLSIKSCFLEEKEKKKNVRLVVTAVHLDLCRSQNTFALCSNLDGAVPILWRCKRGPEVHHLPMLTQQVSDKSRSSVLSTYHSAS